MSCLYMHLKQIRMCLKRELGIGKERIKYTELMLTIVLLNIR